MRVLGPITSALGHVVALTLLVDMDLASGPLYVTTAPIDIDHEGHSYLGGRQVSVEPIEDRGGELQALRFQLSGVPPEMLGLALAEPIQGRSVRLRLALMDAETQAIATVVPLWSGTLDQMPIRQADGGCVITATAEHRGVAFARPKPLRYTDADQRRVSAGDRALEFLVSQSQHQDVWPSAAFFRQ